MAELPKRSANRSSANFEIPRLAISARQLSTDGTEKFLFRLRDGEHIETVAIPEGVADDTVHLVSGRLRFAVLVLRDWCNGVFAQSQGGPRSPVRCAK